VSDSIKQKAQQAMEKATLEAGKALVKSKFDELTLSPEERERREKASEDKKKQNVVLAIVAVIGGVIVLGGLFSLAMHLWWKLLGLALLGGIGYGSYLVVKPMLTSMRDKALAGKRERDEHERQQLEEHKKAEAAQAAHKKLDDELAALKKKASEE
jgi:flagellar motor protein MotB